MEALLSPILQATDLPIDMVKTVIVLLINFIFTIAYRFIVNPSIRSVYGLVVGLTQLVFLLEQDSIYVLIVLVVTLAITNFAKSIPFKTSIACSALFLLAIHLHRFIFDYNSWKVD